METKLATSSCLPIPVELYNSREYEKRLADSEATMTVEKAQALIGIGSQYYPKHVLTCFAIERACHIENEEFKEIPFLIIAKNHLMQDLVVTMVRENGRFDLTNQIPFDYACSNCRGTGQLYKFYRKKRPVDCKFCQGSGGIKEVCPECKGKGRTKTTYFEDDGYADDALIINEVCKRCEGTGKSFKQVEIEGKMVDVKCRSCIGTGKFRKMLLDSKIKSVTPCKECEQKGFFDKTEYHKYLKKQESFNPAMTANVGIKIKSAVVKD